MIGPDQRRSDGSRLNGPDKRSASAVSMGESEGESRKDLGCGLPGGQLRRFGWHRSSGGHWRSRTRTPR